MTDSAKDTTTSMVLLLLRPKLLNAIWWTFAPRVARCFLLNFTCSVYFVASTGETFAAMRAGFEQESRTVTMENAAEPRKITGETLVVVMPLNVSVAVMTGVSAAPIPNPKSSPTGMPIRQSSNACWRIMRRSCLGVVPMVLSSP